MAHGVDRPLAADGGLVPQNVSVKFSVMFPERTGVDPGPIPSDDALIALAQTMHDATSDTGIPDGVPQWDNPDIPAGYTYLGQFIDHDITRDLTPLEAPAGIDVPNARTSRLDLDSVYAGGPDASPALYEGTPGAERFRIGAAGHLPNDLPRDPATAKALIGDPRNDENLLVAQMHLAWLKFHNRLTDALVSLEAGTPDSVAVVFRGAPPGHLPAGVTAAQLAAMIFGVDGTVFERVRRTVVRHYQWVVLNDFLATIADPVTLADVRANGPRFFTADRVEGFPAIPVEFAAAAYRFGHSMIRARYHHNSFFPSATLGEMFQFSGSGGSVPVPFFWVINWRRFFDLDRTTAVNPSRNIDSVVSTALQPMPDGAFDVVPINAALKDLPVRNLLRGKQKRLPTGQRLAEFVNAALPPALRFHVLTPPQFNQAGLPAQDVAITAGGFETDTPLWYYLLREAAVFHAGRRLGPLGTRIVAEVFVGVLEADQDSILGHAWSPTLSLDGQTFRIGDMLRFVGELNPNGGDTGPL